MTYLRGVVRKERKGCFTTTCGGLLRLRLGWKIILVVVFIVVVAIVGIVSIRIVVKVILVCWKIRGFMIVSHRNWNKIFPWLKNINFSISIHSNYLLILIKKTLFLIIECSSSSSMLVLCSLLQNTEAVLHDTTSFVQKIFYRTYNISFAIQCSHSKEIQTRI